jgi:histidine triad (HIT) family protein
MACQYCKNVEGTVASTAIYSDEHGCSFADIHPKSSAFGAPLHVVIVPRDLSPSVNDTDMRNPGALSQLLGMAAEIARTRRLAGDYRIVVSTGDEGESRAGNLHVHLFGGQPVKVMQPRAASAQRHVPGQLHAPAR